jgi:hypothetical protein
MANNTVVIALAGKGGVGKTSLSAAIVRLLAEKRPDAKILAIDADPAVGLSVALGVEVTETLDQIRKRVAEDVTGKLRDTQDILAEAKFRLYEAMEELYKKYGYYLNGTVNASFPGASGAEKMAAIMKGLREEPLKEIAGYKVVGMTDFGTGPEMPRVGGLQKEDPQNLPAANVIEYRLEGDNKVIFRPSGTEPKVKAYLFSKGATRAESEAVRAKLQAAAEQILS